MISGSLHYFLGSSSWHTKSFFRNDFEVPELLLKWFRSGGQWLLKWFQGMGSLCWKNEFKGWVGQTTPQSFQKWFWEGDQSNPQSVGVIFHILFDHWCWMISGELRINRLMYLLTGSYLEHHSFPSHRLLMLSWWSLGHEGHVGWNSPIIRVHLSGPFAVENTVGHPNGSVEGRRQQPGNSSWCHFSPWVCWCHCGFCCFFVVDAFWYRRIKIKSDRSTAYNIIQLLVTLFNRFTNQLTSRKALPRSMPPGNLRAGSPFSLRRHCWCSVGSLKLHEVVASQRCPTVCSTDFSGQIVHSYPFIYS